MTTAQLRNEALEAAKSCKWNDAASLMRQAIEAYPSRETAKPASLAGRDLANMERLADGWESSATFERCVK